MNMILLILQKSSYWAKQPGYFALSSQSTSFCLFNWLYIHILTILYLSSAEISSKSIVFRHFVVPTQVPPLCLCSPNRKTTTWFCWGHMTLPLLEWIFQVAPSKNNDLPDPMLGLLWFLPTDSPSNEHFFWGGNRPGTYPTLTQQEPLQPPQLGVNGREAREFY